MGLTGRLGDGGRPVRRMVTPVDNGPPTADSMALQATVVVRNPQGLHMRPAMTFARIATRYRSVVTVRKLERSVNGKSLLQLMTLAAMPCAPAASQTRAASITSGSPRSRPR